MMIYYPTANTDDGTQFILYKGFDSVEKALYQIEVWEHEYRASFRSAWIDAYDSYGQEHKRLPVAKKWVIESEDA